MQRLQTPSFVKQLTLRIQSLGFEFLAFKETESIESAPGPLWALGAPGSLALGPWAPNANKHSTSSRSALHSGLLHLKGSKPRL